MAHWLAWLHPLWMVGTLIAAGLTLRAGLALRRARRVGGRPTSDAYRRHLRLAKPTVACVLIGFAAGPISMVLWRGREPFETAHAVFAASALAAFVAVAVLGRRLETGAARSKGAREAHGAAALFAVLCAALAAMAGFVLLP